MPVVKFWNCVSWPSAGDRGCWRQGLTDPWPPARHWLSSLSQLRRSGGAPAGWCLATGGWSGDSSPYTSQSRHLQLGVESSRLGRPAERQTECKDCFWFTQRQKGSGRWIDWLLPGVRITPGQTLSPFWGRWDLHCWAGGEWPGQKRGPGMQGLRCGGKRHRFNHEGQGLVLCVHLFIYLFPAVLGLCCCNSLCPVAASRFLTTVVSLAVGHRLEGTWGSVMWLLGSRAHAQMQRTSLVARRHVGSSQIRDQTWVSCIDRWILYCWATRETLKGAIWAKEISELDHLVFYGIRNSQHKQHPRQQSQVCWMFSGKAVSQSRWRGGSGRWDQGSRAKFMQRAQEAHPSPKAGWGQAQLRSSTSWGQHRGGC